MKVVKIDGIKGIITAVFMVACLFAGFVISPGYAAMYLWNRYLAAAYMFPQLSLFQGILLWAIIAITYCILTKNGFAISFKSTPGLNDDELNEIIRASKISSQMRMMNKIISKGDKFEASKKNPYEVKDINVTVPNEKENDDKVSNLK